MRWPLVGRRKVDELCDQIRISDTAICSLLERIERLQARVLELREELEAAHNPT